MIDHARGSMRRGALKRELTEIVAGHGSRLHFDLDATNYDPANVLAHVTARMGRESVQLWRLVAAFHKSGAMNPLIEGLSARTIDRRIRSCRTAGALRMESAVPWLAPLLRAKDARLSGSAARALGRIGGAQAADALLSAIQRSGPRRIFILALAQAAPDLYVETALCSTRRPSALGAVAVAAGLRRRRTAIGPLVALLGNGSHRQRVICCRALAWIKAPSSIPAVNAALYDRDWRVRISAVKALNVLQAESSFENIEMLLQDPDVRVRRVARRALRRLGHLMVRREELLWR